jgi:hypothetical protein
VVLAVVVCGLLWPAGARADAPANDDFADAQALVSGVAVRGDTSEVTAEEGEPVPSTGNGRNDEVGSAVPVTGPQVHATGTNVGATSGWNEWPASATQLV